MFVAHQSIASLLNTNSMSDQIQERDFIAIFERQLGPLVSYNDLKSVFQAIDKMRMGSVISADVLRFVESNSKSPTELKVDIVMKLKA